MGSGSSAQVEPRAFGTEISRKYKSSEEALGQGSFGSVFKVVRADDPSMAGAVKLTPNSGSQEEFWSDYAVWLREVATLSRLSHEHVVRFWDSFEDDENLYLVTELCNGGQLFEQLVLVKRFMEKDAAMIAMQMLLAIRYIHSQGVMHRDIKAENFMFSEPSHDSLVKLIDFGMSETFENGDVFHDICGSRFYVAPEIHQRSYNHMVDMWAIGVLVYLLCCGQYPFKIESIKSGAAFNRPLVWRQKVVLSPETKEFIQLILVPNPAERLSAREALRHEFIGFLDADAITASHQSSMSKLSCSSKLSVDSNITESVKLARQAILSSRDGGAPSNIFLKPPKISTKTKKSNQVSGSSARIVNEASECSNCLGGAQHEVPPSRLAPSSKTEMKTHPESETGASNSGARASNGLCAPLACAIGEAPSTATNPEKAVESLGQGAQKQSSAVQRGSAPEQRQNSKHSLSNELVLPLTLERASPGEEHTSGLSSFPAGLGVSSSKQRQNSKHPSSHEPFLPLTLEEAPPGDEHMPALSSLPAGFSVSENRGQTLPSPPARARLGEAGKAECNLPVPAPLAGHPPKRREVKEGRYMPALRDATDANARAEQRLLNHDRVEMLAPASVNMAGPQSLQTRSVGTHDAGMKTRDSAFERALIISPKTRKLVPLPVMPGGAGTQSKVL